MLFGRLRVPLDREPCREEDVFAKSGVHVIAERRGETPRRPLSLVPSASRQEREDEYAGLDRLDREELDDE